MFAMIHATTATAMSHVCAGEVEIAMEVAVEVLRLAAHERFAAVARLRAVLARHGNNPTRHFSARSLNNGTGA